MQRKKILSLFLTLVLVFSCFPLSAFADDVTEDVQGGEEIIEPSDNGSDGEDSDEGIGEEIDEGPDPDEGIIEEDEPLENSKNATNLAAPAAAASTVQNDNATVKYRAHVQNIGWQGWVTNGATAGTTGQSKRVEALQASITNTQYSGGITYSAHVQNIGWQAWKSNGATAGTSGQSKRVEAIKIKLTGELANNYDVYYRVHSQQYGWLSWAKNGAVAGTSGFAFRAESLQIKLVKKGASAPGATVVPYVSKATVTYSAHVQGIGWQAWKSNGATAGTSGKSKRVEALKIKLNSSISGGIEYTSHVQNIGWQGARSNGAISGTTGQSKRVEAFTIKLTGQAASYYDVYYRVHSQAYGWLGWAKNGAKAGTANCSYRAEAVQIAIVAKGASAPGSTAGAFKDKKAVSGPQATMNSKANGKSSSTKWLLMIDNKNCRVGVYYGSKGNWTNRYYWACSPGKSSTPTVKGTYKVQNKGYSFGHGYTCYYWTQFYGNYLFHSVLYNQGTKKIQDGRLGQQLSLGCVRLDINNAKWIYDNIPRGTTVVSY